MVSRKENSDSVHISNISLVSILIILMIFHVQFFEYLTYQALDWFFIRSLKAKGETADFRLHRLKRLHLPSTDSTCLLTF